VRLRNVSGSLAPVHVGRPEEPIGMRYHPTMTSSIASLLAAAGAALLAATMSAQTPPPQTPAAAGRTVESRFPAGPGRDALFKVCKECHGPESQLGQLTRREG